MHARPIWLKRFKSLLGEAPDTMIAKLSRKVSCRHSCALHIWLTLPCKFFWGHFALLHTASIITIVPTWQVSIAGPGVWQVGQTLNNVSNCERKTIYFASVLNYVCRTPEINIQTTYATQVPVIQRTRVRFPAGRPWSCIFHNWSRFGSYNVYLHDTRISYTYNSDFHLLTTSVNGKYY